MEQEPQTTRPIGKAMVIIAWILLLVFLSLFFNKLLNEQRNPNQQVGGAVSGNVNEIVLERNHYGHYVATARINQHDVEVMVDTGATTVSIPEKLAQQLGLKRGPAIQVETANGRITAYVTRLDEVQLGTIKLTNVPANINPYSQDILLGMSFLKQLEFSQRGKQLTLRQYNH
ncbi:MAG: TIGR02281 family clan AA aspartic protease [Gammaproteobacteria bacterium]|nr:TIGR02281 family clan AA aspartic protease [Gammaproteobacteria bacterium]